MKDRSYAELRATHVEDHRRLFRRVKIDLGGAEASKMPTNERLDAIRRGVADPQLAALYFQYGRYLMMASARPGTLTPHLQGIWSETIRPIWHSGYCLNLNEQMNFWPAEVANLAECHTTLFDLMDGLVKPGQRTAQIHYGARGWAVHLMTDIWGFTEPGYGPYGYWPMTTAWLCRHPWEHYLYNGNKEFLAKRAFPLMKGAAQFLLDFLVEAPQGTPVAGKLVTNPSQSPEDEFTLPNGLRGYLTYGSTVDLMIARELFTNCIRAIDILGLKEEAGFRANLEAAKQAGAARGWSIFGRVLVRVTRPIEVCKFFFATIPSQISLTPIPRATALCFRSTETSAERLESRRCCCKVTNLVPGTTVCG
ncbi:MAG: hypothetical protein EXQ58_00055 [Acidobacteria bacterium]|nr:hypothetical protein [Acidobacteriota bacterium]